MKEKSRAANENVQQAVDWSNTCMLVSDSNEVSKQLDSKQLPYDTLASLAEDNLFTKYLDMSKYLTKNQYEVYRGMLKDRKDAIVSLKSTLENSIFDPGGETMVNYKPKLRVVDGQVILVEATRIPSDKSPREYVEEQWDITSDYQLLPIPNCMLRGILGTTSDPRMGQGISLVADKPGNQEVNLKPENMPPHMHHSSVTTGAGFTTMTKDEADSTGSYFIKGNTVYDMFYNDSLDIGLSKNELDGTVDKFTVDMEGRNDGKENDPTLMAHDNMPKYQSFYGFVVHKMT